MKLIDPREIMPRDIEDAIRQHGVEEYPRESIGAIWRDKYIRIPNVSDEPEKYARPDPEVYFNLLLEGGPVAMVHSHPDAPFCPSAPDMQAQIDANIPFGVFGVYRGAATRVALWGDQLVRRDLIKRDFQHGITDCYEAVRDHFFENCGVLIKQFPRNWDWWTPRHGQNLYIDGFREAGFSRVDPEDAREHDVVIFRIRAEAHNHASVYLGNGRMYHHATDREPYVAGKNAERVTLSRWLKYDPIFVRPSFDHPAILHR